MKLSRNIPIPSPAAKGRRIADVGRVMVNALAV
jgi:hypothetical protein